jgi:DNA-binding transcriptional regulator YiaG
VFLEEGQFIMKKLSEINPIKPNPKVVRVNPHRKITLLNTWPPPPPPQLSPKKIAALRRRLKMSQPYFAALLNVSAGTVKDWEQGLRRPGHAALRMLQLIAAEPSVAQAIVGKPVVRIVHRQRRPASADAR